MPDQNALPTLDTRYPLSKDQIEAYRHDGHLYVPALASASEVETYREVITDATMRHNRETRPLGERDTYGKAFLQVMNLWAKDDRVRRFTLAKRFARVAAELMGVPRVRLYHDQALFKEPGGGHTPWHQDQYYWPLGTDNTITLWMPLVDLTGEMHGMTFASGSHAERFLGHIGISDASEALFAAHVAKRGFPTVDMLTMSAGDATFHSGWTLHCAPGNPTDRVRAVMTIIYFADGALALEPDNPNRAADLETWIPGVKPGQLAASELNPVVYDSAIDV